MYMYTAVLFAGENKSDSSDWRIVPKNCMYLYVFECFKYLTLPSRTVKSPPF
jgi:hypothetical protein